jgi:nitroreductase/NAD-dependent dihydropyrimidine dehydrogenase PreA subunit
MPIIGIDYDKCANCGICSTICGRNFKEDKKQDKIVFEDPKGRCTLCGHCIAVCPEDAIIHKNMGQSVSFEGVDKPEALVSYDSLFKLLRAHRSIRHYKREKVPTDLLQKVCDAMQYAPTGRNMRSEYYSILSDEKQIKTLSDAVQKELLSNPGMRDMYEENFAISAKRYKSVIFHDAPHVVFVFSGLNVEIETSNIAILITYGRLAAQSLGLGTCWNGLTTQAMESNPKLKELVGVRGSKVGVFTIGYPDETYYRVPPRAFKTVKGLW